MTATSEPPTITPAAQSVASLVRYSVTDAMIQRYRDRQEPSHAA